MIILVGASASGKTVVVNNLVEKYGYTKLVTYTSRNKRINEVEGIDYKFLTKEEFKYKIDNGFFFEYVEYNNNYYGTALEDITKDKVVILEPNGLKTYLNSNLKDIVSFFLDCGEDVRFKRMKNRKDDIESINKRILSDKEVFKKENINGIDYIMSSDSLTLDELTKEIDKLYKITLNNNEK